MHRAISLFIIIIALLPIALYIIYEPPVQEPTPFAVNQEDRATLLAYAYQSLYQYFARETTSLDTFPPLSTDALNYDILFITLLTDGKVRGCQSGSTNRLHVNRIFLDIREAVEESIEDDRFGGKFQEDELHDSELMFTFLYNISWLYNTSLPFLQNNIELGVHALELFYNNTPTIFKESVPIEHNYDHEHLLERLCEKAELPANCWSNEMGELFRYDTLTFVGKLGEPITELYRYGLLRNMSDISQTSIYEGLTLASGWYLNDTNTSTHRLEYLYYPSNDSYASDNNHLRQLASVWAMVELQDFLGSTTLSDTIDQTLDYYNAFRVEDADGSYVLLDGDADLGTNAFLILSLLQIPDYPSQETLMDQYVRGILSLQKEDGSFRTYFKSNRTTGVNYYPGEAMLALMHSYMHTHNETLLQAVQRGFVYYRDYWRSNHSTAFVPWHTQADTLLFNVTHDLDVAAFIFEMNDWLIDSYQIQTSPFKDELGGFPQYFPTFTTSVFLEGISEAYTVALMVNDSDHVEKYSTSLRNGTRFILQTQWTHQNAFYVEDKSKTIGGFKTSLTDTSIRIDNTQHAVMALMKVYAHQIFAP